MLRDHFPLVGLRLRTPRLELRLPNGRQLADLAALAADGVHDPAVMPFTVPWTDLPPAERARSVITHYWSRMSTTTPENWSLPLVVLRDGEVAGLQDIHARDFAVTREVATGSWLGLRHQGRGTGTEMRAAVLHLAFAGLDAVYATSGAHEGNESSYAVSGKLGYRPDGVDRMAVRGAPAVSRRLRLTRDDWEAHRTVPVTIEGLDRCRAEFGLSEDR